MKQLKVELSEPDASGIQEVKIDMSQLARMNMGQLERQLDRLLEPDSRPLLAEGPVQDATED